MKTEVRVDIQHEGGRNTLTLDLVENSITNSGDHERFAHYVEKDEALVGLVDGKPVIALCGKVWIPSRDPSKFPICPTCEEVLKALFLREQ